MNRVCVIREIEAEELNVTIPFHGRRSVGQFVWHIFSVFLLTESEHYEEINIQARHLLCYSASALSVKDTWIVSLAHWAKI
jgi:hypothetical protein